MERAIRNVVLSILVILVTIPGAVFLVQAEDSSNLSIQGSSTVPENTQASYNASYRGSRVSASWSLSSTRYATINSTTGALAAGSVSSNQTVTITARYRRNETTYTATKTVTITNEQGSTSASLTRVTVSGPASATSGSTTSYTATATFSNNTTQDVTASATWRVSPAVGTIAAGRYSPGTVTTNTNVTLSASYTAGGVTMSGNLPVTVRVGTTTATLTRVTVSGPSTVTSGSVTSYTATATFSNNTTQDVTASATWSVNPAVGTIAAGRYSPGTVTTNTNVTLSASYTSGNVTMNGTLPVAVQPTTTTSGGKSINSTSQNRSTVPTTVVTEQPLTNLTGFSIFSVNDLGMHCGDLDHRVASILPPFNTLHAQVIQKGTSSANPQILTSTDVDVVYSAASNPKDPALQNPVATGSIYKTNFWDPNPRTLTNSIMFDCYNSFYPPNILNTFSLLKDNGLPSTDNAQLYPVTGTGRLVAGQQKMPGISAPYTANVPQPFDRFDTDFPFFVSFTSFGYRLTAVNWFSADGISLTPVDDFGRINSFPLMRVQAKSKSASLAAVGSVIASVDAVTPVSGETTCYKCHTSSVDGGNGAAADLATGGSKRSTARFTVAQASQDTSTSPPEVKREWAADTNIVRLHDAKHGTHLATNTPVSCQICHYTPALDLAHVGPLGPTDANANGRDQKVHKTNSRVMHSFHAQFTDLFQNDLAAPTNALRGYTTAAGKPTINTYVTDKLNNSCYQCHPGQTTKCLRGAMFNGGLVCNDCHGNMTQVGNDFSANFSSTTPFPNGADNTKRVPWANEPKCQSCHTGDAMSNLASSANVIKAGDGIRLLQAWRTNDANATPITATNTRFAEETVSGKSVLYRLSKGHSGLACQTCHGSTHAEWPVQPESGTYIANDNMAAIQMQGHAGTITECTACHTAGLSVTLGGPHGMHPVGNSSFISGHSRLVSTNRADCQACHGQTGQGTVLSKVSVNRTVGSRTFTKGEMISCSRCHSNPL